MSTLETTPTSSKTSVVTSTHWIFVLSLIALLPLIMQQAWNSWLLPWMWFSPISLIVLAVYCYRVPKIGFAASPLRRQVALGLMVFGCVVGLAGAFLVIPGLGLLAAIFVTTGWLLIWLGIVPWTRIVALTSLLWVTWQPPFGLGSRLLDWLERQSLTSAGLILDWLGFRFFLDGSSIQLVSNQLEMGGLRSSWDSLYVVLFATLVLLIWARRQTLLGVLTLATVPLVGWTFGTLHILIVVWASESGSGNWLEGWPSVLLPLTLLLIQLFMVVLVSYGWAHMFEPLPATPSDAQKGVDVQAIYNKVVLWPLRFALPVGEDGRFETADAFDGDKAVDVSPRAVPSFRATRAAHDPWPGSRWLRPTFIMLGATAIFGLFGLVPLGAPDSANVSLAEKPDEAIGSVLARMSLPETLVLSAPSSVESDDGQEQIISIAVQDADRMGTLSMVFPIDRFRATWQALEQQGWTPRKPATIPEVVTTSKGELPVIALELYNELGGNAFACFAAVDPQGQSAVPSGSLWEKISRRLATSVVGRLFGKPSQRNLLQSQLFIESPNRFSTRQIAAYRELLVTITLGAAETTITQR